MSLRYIRLTTSNSLQHIFTFHSIFCTKSKYKIFRTSYFSSPVYNRISNSIILWIWFSTYRDKRVTRHNCIVSLLSLKHNLRSHRHSFVYKNISKIFIVWHGIHFLYIKRCLLMSGYTTSVYVYIFCILMELMYTLSVYVFGIVVSAWS